MFGWFKHEVGRLGEFNVFRVFNVFSLPALELLILIASLCVGVKDPYAGGDISLKYGSAS